MYRGWDAGKGSEAALVLVSSVFVLWSWPDGIVATDQFLRSSVAEEVLKRTVVKELEEVRGGRTQEDIGSSCDPVIQSVAS